MLKTDGVDRAAPRVPRPAVNLSLSRLLPASRGRHSLLFSPISRGALGQHHLGKDASCRRGHVSRHFSADGSFDRKPRFPQAVFFRPPVAGIPCCFPLFPAAPWVNTLWTRTLAAGGAMCKGTLVPTGLLTVSPAFPPSSTNSIRRTRSSCVNVQTIESLCK